MKTSGSMNRRRSVKAARHEPMAEINVTPFVDVILVLLIIFIVTAPLLSVGVEVNLPETSARALPASEEEPLTLTIAASGEVAIQATIIDRDELIPRLRAIMEQRASGKIYLRGDGEAKYETIMQIMGALNNAGYRDLALVTKGGGPALDGGSN